jgi:hypothetical protein
MSPSIPGGKFRVTPGGIQITLTTVDGGSVAYNVAPAIRLSFAGRAPGPAGPTVDAARTRRTIDAGLAKLARLEQRLRDALPFAAE